MKRSAQADVCRPEPGKPGFEGCDRKKALRPAEKRELVQFVCEEHGLSISRACTALRMSRTVFAYKPSPRDDMPVISALLGLVERYPRYGFAKYFAVLRREGSGWNHKRVHRIYRELQLHLRRKGEKTSAFPSSGSAGSSDSPERVLVSGFYERRPDERQRFRTFNVLDDFSREILPWKWIPICRQRGSSGCLTASRLGVGILQSCVWIMARSSFPCSLQPGQNNTAWNWSSSSRASRHKTHTWNASIAPSETRY